MTTNFQRWFSGSKVVDTNGKPIVVYHGTSTDAGVANHGIYVFDSTDNLSGWFSSSIEKATDYANRYEFNKDGRSGAQVYPVFLVIRNPLVVPGEIQRTVKESPEFIAVAQSIGVDLEYANNDNFVWQELNEHNFIEAAISAGYDGIHAIESGEETFAVFRPEQIKSAIGNSGMFDPASPDICDSGSVNEPTPIRWRETSDEGPSL